MDTRMIEYFIEIANENSLTAAASKLYLSQPALSQQLKKLEDLIGTPLFHRHGNSLELTDAGKIFLNGAQSMMHVKNQAYQQISSLKRHAADSIQGIIQSNFSEGFETFVLPEFQQRFPNIEVITKAIPGAAAPDYLLNGLANFAVVFCRETGHPALEYLPLGTEELVLALPQIHPFVTAHQEPVIRDFTPLACEPFIFSSSDPDMRSLETAALNSCRYSPGSRYSAQNYESLLYMILDGAGMGLLPASKAQGSSALKLYRLEPVFLLHSYIIYNKNLTATPALTCLFELIKNRLVS